ncbi:beta-lactamase family protein [Draconibacterium sp.]|nr:beta-lactamase family protein [Draconibacterium sp.]
MKRSVKISILLVLVLLFTNCEKRESNILYDKQYIEEIKAAREKVGFFLARNSIPGATIAISRNGKIIYSEGIGLASKELEVPATRKTKFRIGNASELFTSFIYLKMVEEGKLHPDSSIQHYLPDFPKKEYRINLQHLVNHTSGIREATNTEENWGALNVTIQKGLDSFKNDPLDAYPGLYQTPSMFNYNLLGAIMEKVTDTRFPRILEAYVTDTLHLTNTVVDNPQRIIMGRTQFFDLNLIAQTINASSRDMRYKASSTGILSNAEDLAKFGHAIIQSDLLSEDTKKNMFEPVPLFDDIPSEMVNGWLLLIDSSNNTIYGKSGNVTGGTASIIIYPEYDLVIACATNLSTSINDTPVFEVAALFLPESAKNKQEEKEPGK